MIRKILMTTTSFSNIYKQIYKMIIIFVQF